MALFKTFRGQRTDLDNVAKVDGHAYFCMDDGTFWIDYKDNGEVKRKQINKEDWTKDIQAAVAALKSEIEEELVNKTDYLGAVSSLEELSTIAGNGDFHRVSQEFQFGDEIAHVGDLLIALINLPAQTPECWDLIHTGVTVQVDYEQNDENAQDYIKNRPFYEIPSRTLSNWEKNTSLETVTLKGKFGSFTITVAKYKKVDTSVILEEDFLKSFITTKNEKESVLEGKKISYEKFYVYDETTVTTSGILALNFNLPQLLVILEDGVDISTLLPSDDNVVVQAAIANAGIYVLSNYKYDAMVSIEYGGGIKQIDDKFVPDTIARVEDIPKVDQTYNSESENAQSGIAVAEAIENSKEIVVVDIEKMIVEQDVTLFMDLSKRFASGEIVIVGSLFGQTAVVNAVDIREEKKANWSAVAGQWLNPIIKGGGFDPFITVFGFECDGEKIVGNSGDIKNPDLSEFLLKEEVDQVYNSESENAQSGLAVTEAIQNFVNSIVSITWAELKQLRDSAQLVPGQFYRITDYQCTTIQEDTRAMNHQFDIIVQALSDHTLSEDAKADYHDGDTYFTSATAQVCAWELKYCLDNDTDRFVWAAEHGTGVIYYMKDEWNNEAPYDFKNIQFIRKVDIDMFKFDPENGEDSWCYTFGGFYDRSIYHGDGDTPAYDNFIGFYSPNPNVLMLPDNVFIDNGTATKPAHNNKLGNNCTGNTFGELSWGNIFGNNCTNNTFIGQCQRNVFGDDCSTNKAGYKFGHNIFSNFCYNNTFGQDIVRILMGPNCERNTFGDECRSISCQDTCKDNIFGNKNKFITFGCGCVNNCLGEKAQGVTFGHTCRNNIFNGRNAIMITLETFCRYITLGNADAPIDYCRYISVAPMCSYINICSEDTVATASNYLQNIVIHEGIMGASDTNRLTITVPDRNLQSSIDYYKSGSQEVYL